MNRLKTVSVLFLVCSFLIMNTSTACSSKSKKSEEKQKISVYIDIKDRNTLDLIRTFLDEYKKEKPNVEVSMNNPLGGSKLEEDIVKGSIDMLFIPRNMMLDLSKKGLLSDMGQFYAKNKISDKYYNIVAAYGRSGDKYYGIGLMPFSIEAIYNTQALKKMNLAAPQNFNDLMAIFRQFNTTGNKVPVLLGDGIDIRNAAAAITFGNSVDTGQVEKAYGKDSSNYSQINLQPMFDMLNTLVKQGSLTENTFEIAGDGAVKRLMTGDVPLIIAMSSVTKDLKNAGSTGEKSGSAGSSVGTGETGSSSTTSPQNLEVLKSYDISKTKNNIPVLVNAVISMPANTKNEEAVNDLLSFIYGESAQKKLAEMGYITANKSVNTKMWKTGMNKDIAEHLQKADSNSIFYLYEFPDKFQTYMETAVINILKGKYTGNEWKDIVDKSSK